MLQGKPQGDLKESRRKISYALFFTANEEKIKVCKKFYLGTLGISQKMVYNVHEGIEPDTGIPKTNKKTTSNAAKRIIEERKENVCQHLSLFL